MRSAYLLQGLLFIGLIFVAVYAMQSRKVQNTSDIIVSTNSPMTIALSLTSSAFEQNARIPSKYTCDEGGVSPPLVFSNVPEGAKSLALIMDDPDVPKALRPDGVFDHWIVFNLPPSTGGIAEGESVETAGANSAGRNMYTSPCPPPQYEPKEHRYVFTLYALDTELPLKEGATKQEVLNAMEGHVVQRAELIGKYKRE